MSSAADHLRKEQYKDSSNLQARIELHRRFSTNSQGWARWLFEQMAAVVPEGARVLEIGCGPATIWGANRASIPASWSLTLTDFSVGMVAEAKGVLADRALYAVADAQALPARDGRFDVVIANHMLYHVPDRPLAIAEMTRVLVRGGVFIASTVGDNHLAEIDACLRRTGVAVMPLSGTLHEFTLENGAAQLGTAMRDVRMLEYEDSLRVTEVDPLIAYVLSMTSAAQLSTAALAELRDGFTAEIAARGYVSITKSSGVFLARA